MNMPATQRNTTRGLRSTVTLPNALPALYARLARSCGPRPVRTVADWSDAHRVLSSKASSEVGPWRTSRVPYLREILDALSVTSPVQRIVMKFAAQTAKTETTLCWVGYVMHHAPAPMLVVVPTLEVRKRWVKQRLDPMLAETPVLRALLGGNRSRDAANSEDMKDFPGGMVVIGGANSAASLASMPIKYVICDEVDRFPWEVGQEGDPLGLIDERTKTFPRRKVLLASTPTVKGLSRIEGEYEQSDQREYHVPCPHCSQAQVLRWRHDDGSYGLVHSPATGAVRYACRHCGSLIDEHHKPQMLARGVWVPRFPDRLVRGYHLSGLYSPLGLGFTWAELWQAWQDAHADTVSLKRFINTTLAEVWEERGDSIDDMALILRREKYPESLPLKVITSFTDVQKDRLETTVVGWGDGEEAWVLAHEIHDGDTVEQDVWDDLAAFLEEHAPARAGVDAGYVTGMVHTFCAVHARRVATKGVAGMHRPLVEDALRRKQRLRKRRRKGAAVEPLGVDQGKALVYSRVRLVEPGAGFVHFPELPEFDDEYFAQLAAEKLVTRTRNGRPRQEWVQTRARNEALDCLVGCYAMLRLHLDGRAIEDLPLLGTRQAAEQEATPKVRARTTSAGVIRRR